MGTVYCSKEIRPILFACAHAFSRSPDQARLQVVKVHISYIKLERGKYLF